MAAKLFQVLNVCGIEDGSQHCSNRPPPIHVDRSIHMGVFDVETAKIAHDAFSASVRRTTPMPMTDVNAEE